MTDDQLDLVDWSYFEKTRAELGGGFIRILGYFREDGVKSLGQIEAAMHEKNSVALVLPSHTLKGEARMFGAGKLADVAESIENVARSCIETRRFPDEIIPEVVELRRLFSATVELFDKATNPLLTRAAPQGAFGRKSSNQSFGRI